MCNMILLLVSDVLGRNSHLWMIHDVGETDFGGEKIRIRGRPLTWR